MVRELQRVRFNMLTIYKNNSFKETQEKPPLPVISPLIYSDTNFFLVANYVICVCLNGAKIEIFIPKGFIFDGASIPRFFWRIVGHPFHPKRVIAALVHDALFGKIDGRVKIWIGGYLLDNERAMKFFDRKKTDQVFQALLQACKNSGFINFTMTKAVRIGGRFFFRKLTNKFITDIKE